MPPKTKPATLKLANLAVRRSVPAPVSITVHPADSDGVVKVDIEVPGETFTAEYVAE
jgi:hypothetical protein